MYGFNFCFTTGTTVCIKYLIIRGHLEVRKGSKTANIELITNIPDI